MPVPRDVHWVRNVELTRRNVLHLLEKIKFKHQEWVMLAGRVSLHEEDIIKNNPMIKGGLHMQNKKIILINLMDLLHLS